MEGWHTAATIASSSSGSESSPPCSELAFDMHSEASSPESSPDVPAVVNSDMSSAMEDSDGE